MSKINWKIVLTVAVTIAVAAAFIGAFYLGTQFQQHIHDQVLLQSKQLTQLKQ